MTTLKNTSPHFVRCIIPQMEDEGIYICQASVTSTGEVQRLEINVQVMTPPKWVVEPKDTEGVNGQDVIINDDPLVSLALH